MKQSETSTKVIDTATIRLTADETRAIMKAATNAPKTISDYRCCGLVDLGIMRLVAVEPPNRDADKKECWNAIKIAAAKHDQSAIQKHLNKLDEFSRLERNKERGYVLTDLGKQVARGVKVSLNGQYKTVPC